MKNPEKYLHNWELDERSLLIRFYLFWYPDVNKHSITFCKLFWAVTCAPLMGVAWVLYGIFYSIVLPFLLLHDKWKASHPSSEKPPRTKRPPKPKRSAGAIPKAFAWLADHVSAFFQAHPGFGKGFRWSALVSGAVAAIGGSTYGIARLTAFINGNWSQGVFYWVLFWIGIVAGIILVSAGIGTLFAKTGLGAWLGDVLYRGCCAVGRFFRAIGHFVAAGFYATKYRTCPRVIVKS